MGEFSDRQHIQKNQDRSLRVCIIVEGNRGDLVTKDIGDHNVFFYDEATIKGPD